MIPEVHAVYDIGTETRRWRKLWVSERSLHIGDIRLGATGRGDEAKLDIRTITGKSVSDVNESLQAVEGDVDLTDTSTIAYAVNTSIVGTDNTLTVSDGVEFIVI